MGNEEEVPLEPTTIMSALCSCAAFNMLSREFPLMTTVVHGIWAWWNIKRVKLCYV